MGYERNDRRYGERSGGDYGRDRYGARDEGYRGASYGYNSGGAGGRDYRGDRFNDRGDYGRDPRGYDYQDRGFFERAGDEVRSWFGDEEAERRRRDDERRYEQSYGQDGDRYRAGSTSYGSGYGGNSYGGNSYGGGSSWRGSGQTGDAGYGGNSGADWGRERNARQERHDPSYRSWRDRQMEAFDRDYDDYRRENQSRFDQEFHSWRQGRQGQRDLLAKVKEHAEVVGSDGQHVGTVDHVRSDTLLLTKSDQAAGGRHHSIPSAWLQSVDEDGKVTLSKTADQARQQWRDEQRNQQDGGLFGRDEGNRSSSYFDRAFGER